MKDFQRAGLGKIWNSMRFTRFSSPACRSRDRRPRRCRAC
ncbi:hypothetical protein [Chromobacterium subtsugae]